MSLDRQLERPWARLERQKQAMLSELGSWSTQRVSYRPAAGEWSALEVVDHLARMESAFVATVQSHLHRGTPVRWRDRWNGLLVHGVMLLPMRVKVPGAAAARVRPEAVDAAVIPQGMGQGMGQDMSQDMSQFMAGRWNRAREELAALLQQLAPAQLTRGVFRHPVAGWMTAPQGLVFLSAHLHHHGYQIARLRRSTRGL